MREGYSRTIHKFAEENNMGRNPKTMSRQLEVREGEQLQGGREIAVRGCSTNSWSQGNVCVRDEQQNREAANWGVREGFLLPL